jgi:transcriptional regulator with XRE-family HTH domain
MNALSKEESDRMLTLLERSIRQSELSKRELERRLGLSQGYLGGLFKGRIQLKVSHVYGIAHALDIEPLFLFLQVSPPKDPDWLLKQLGIGKDQLLSFLAHGGRLPTPQEMVEIIQAALRSELERLFGTPPEPEETDPPQG